MLDVFRKILFDAAPDAADVPSAQRAVAALLVEAAQSDGDFEEAERRLIDSFLAAMFELDMAAARALRADGEADHKDAADLVRFTRVVKTGLDEDERVRVMEALWQVILSDDTRHPREDALMRKLAPLLGLSDRHSALARRKVAGLD